MCDGCCGEMGGMSSPMNNGFNTMGTGDICWDNQTMTGSGDRFDMTVGNWLSTKRSMPKKKRQNNNSEFNQFRSLGSKTSGSFDFSQKPLYVPINKK